MVSISWKGKIAVNSQCLHCYSHDCGLYCFSILWIGFEPVPHTAAAHVLVVNWMHLPCTDCTNRFLVICNHYLCTETLCPVVFRCGSWSTVWTAAACGGALFDFWLTLGSLFTLATHFPYELYLFEPILVLIMPTCIETIDAIQSNSHWRKKK